jgi:hypothetical protein
MMLDEYSLGTSLIRLLSMLFSNLMVTEFSRPVRGLMHAAIEWVSELTSIVERAARRRRRRFDIESWNGEIMHPTRALL